ncbi:hypothetical protein B9Z19DRAFT_1097411 [Tuber borchii]|uniref:Uncharacterized protein n=1 Tax=Tuber borchii TaxID=42251 RepID=A0A2T6ZA44_TUBBO|nr:hypothetical protein B9Z19DRAFT_1097411 [Tuber borchii]
MFRVVLGRFFCSAFVFVLAARSLYSYLIVVIEGEVRKNMDGEMGGRGFLSMIRCGIRGVTFTQGKERVWTVTYDFFCPALSCRLAW